MSAFEAWIGREQRASDRLDESLAARWLASFDRPMPSPALMPQGIHLCLCTPQASSSALGADGHPAREDSEDSFLPPFDMPRRMWASSDIEFHAPIAVGAVIERVSTIASISEKQGGPGKLAFVDIAHETRANGTLSVREVQTIVYREAASSEAPLSPPEIGNPAFASGAFDSAAWDTGRAITPDPRLLFRFSALTFNTHRIHYDAPYAREVERYRGLVVHGPLIASLLLQLAADHLGDNRLRRFAFRGVSPAIADETLHLVMRQARDGFELGTFADDGRQVTKASAQL